MVEVEMSLVEASRIVLNKVSGYSLGTFVGLVEPLILPHTAKRRFMDLADKHLDVGRSMSLNMVPETGEFSDYLKRGYTILFGAGDTLSLIGRLALAFPTPILTYLEIKDPASVEGNFLKTAAYIGSYLALTELDMMCEIIKRRKTGDKRKCRDYFGSGGIGP